LVTNLIGTRRFRTSELTPAGEPDFVRSEASDWDESRPD
jgi:hypothetical protein